MRSFGTLVLAFLVSGFIAGAMQNGLAAGWFDAGYEYLFAMAVLSPSPWSRRLLSAWPWPAISASIASRYGFWASCWCWWPRWASLAAWRDFPLLLYIAIPCALMLVIQWWLVHRRALAAWWNLSGTGRLDFQAPAVA